MLRIAICDDEQEAVESHKKAVEAALGLLRAVGEMITYTSSDNLFCDIVEAGFHFDLILLDIEMPGMNGIETFERMKSFVPEIPVIFLTASGLEEDVVSAIKLGAVNYLKKPYRPQELLKRISQEFEKR